MANIYVPRIVDSVLREKLDAFGATHIIGPKWCGKTTTAKQVPIRPPDLKIVLTGGEYGFRRPDGVYEIPVGCLRD